MGRGRFPFFVSFVAFCKKSSFLEPAPMARAGPERRGEEQRRERQDDFKGGAHQSKGESCRLKAAIRELPPEGGNAGGISAFFILPFAFGLLALGRAGKRAS